MAKSKIHYATEWDVETRTLTVPSLPTDGGVAFVEIPPELGCFNDAKRHMAVWTGALQSKEVMFTPHGWFAALSAKLGDGWTFVV
jgi:hypothetical protein